jgi:DNA-binding transcriptional LysR family regulator
MNDDKLTRKPILDPAVADLLANMEQKQVESQMSRSERRKRNRERAKIAARRDARVTYDLPPALRQHMKKMAEKEHLPASQLVTLALIRFLEDVKQGEIDLGVYKEPSESPRYDWNLVIPEEMLHSALKTKK